MSTRATNRRGTDSDYIRRRQEHDGDPEEEPYFSQYVDNMLVDNNDINDSIGVRRTLVVNNVSAISDVSVLGDELVDEEINSNIVLWPERGTAPINERTGSHILAGAFPTLFPLGSGDITFNGHRRKSLSFNEACKHYVKYYDPIRQVYPFASNARFCHYIQDKDERSRIQSQCSVWMSMNPTDAALSIGNMREIVHRDQTLALITKRMQRLGANITGSAAYMALRKKELLALMEQEGLGTIWFTITTPTWMWADLRNIFGNHPARLVGETENEYNERSIKYSKEQHLKNPHIVNEFFLRRVAKFIEYYFGPDCLPSDWTWYRVEWQSRGEPHVHGLARLKHAADLTNLTKAVIDGRRSLAVLTWLKLHANTDSTCAYYDILVEELEDPYPTDSISIVDVLEHLNNATTGFFTWTDDEQINKIVAFKRSVAHGKECCRKIISFREYSLTCVNPNVPLPADADKQERDAAVHHSTREQIVHPCINSYSEFLTTGKCSFTSDHSKKTYADLVNWCQRHRHNQSYCMRTNQVCRFDFPKPLLTETRISIIDILYRR